MSLSTGLQRWMDRHRGSNAEVLRNILRPDPRATWHDLDEDAERDLVETLQRSVAIGAVCDAFIGFLKAWPSYKHGHISYGQLIAYMANEAGCGAISAGGGNMVRYYLRRVTSSTTGAIGGLLASTVLRHVYRQWDLGPDLPDHPSEAWDGDSLEDDLQTLADLNEDDD